MLTNRDFYKERMRSYRAGRCGEIFCEEAFGIREPEYEIKATGHKGGSFTVQVWQLLENLHLEKQYVVVNYHRASRRLSRGARKGCQTFTETVEEAFKKPVDVHVVPAHIIVQMAVDSKARPWCVARNKNVIHYGKWGIVWRILLSALPTVEQEKTDRYTLWYDPMYPPRWLGKVVRSPGMLDFGGNGKEEREPGDEPPSEKPPEVKEKLPLEVEDDMPF